MSPQDPKCVKCVIWVHMIFLLQCIISVQHSAVSISSTIQSLPGFPGPLPFKLETGYIGVDKSEDVQLFYYVESEGNPREDPLLLWLSGGPGCSALTPLLLEIGPMRFNIVEYNGSLPTFVPNPHSWTKVSSVIFLDVPVGTGFSYSRTLQGHKTGDRSTAHHSSSFMREWLISHPEFLKNPLYIAGDSYAGLLVPLIVQELSEGIEAGLEPGLNLKGYLLGNPATHLDRDFNSRIQFAHKMSLIPDELYESTKISCNREYINVDQENSECLKYLRAVSECTKQINPYHVLDSECVLIFGMLNEMHTGGTSLEETYAESLFSLPQLPSVGCRNYVDVLSNVWANDAAVQEALHIRKGTIRIWDRCSKTIDYVREVESTVEHHLNLTTRGFRALIYRVFGDHDMAIPFLGTLSWIKSLNFSIVDDWRPWFVDGQVAGYTRVYSNNLTFATVKGAGHTAPEDNPKECLPMFRRWISHEPL